MGLQCGTARRIGRGFAACTGVQRRETSTSSFDAKLFESTDKRLLLQLRVDQLKMHVQEEGPAKSLGTASQVPDSYWWYHTEPFIVTRLISDETNAFNASHNKSPCFYAQQSKLDLITHLIPWVPVPGDCYGSSDAS